MGKVLDGERRVPTDVGCRRPDVKRIAVGVVSVADLVDPHHQEAAHVNYECYRSRDCTDGRGRIPGPRNRNISAQLPD